MGTKTTETRGAMRDEGVKRDESDLRLYGRARGVKSHRRADTKEARGTSLELLVQIAGRATATHSAQLTTTHARAESGCN